MIKIPTPTTTILVGEFTGKNEPYIQRMGWGRVWIARNRIPRIYEGEPWAFDNGAYRDWKAGVDFQEWRFLKAMNRCHDLLATAPLWAVLPDIPAGGQKSLALSVKYLERVGQDLPADWPWMIAVQDGLTPEDLEPYAHRIAGIFLGGSDEYKATAGLWSEWAHARGLKFHFGRCGTTTKLTQAAGIHADSIDSAFPLTSYERLRKFTHTVWDLFGSGRTR